MTTEKLYQHFLEHPLISTDTRKILPGSLFFALKGTQFNGNAYAQDALEKGAAYAIIDEETYRKSSRFLLVNDVLGSLQQLARHHRRQLKIPFIAITGSNGKTTTKELVHAVLSTTRHSACTLGNLNNHIGVPLTLLSIDRHHDIAIIEMGANHQHEIEFLCGLAEPTHGLITNIGKAHLEGFGGIEGVKKGKGELFSWLKSQHGIIFLHQDQEDLRDLLGNYDQVLTYGTNPDCDVSGVVKGHGEMISFRWKKKGRPETYSIQTNLAGDYNLPNLLAAACIGDFFNVSPVEISKALSAYVPGNQRSQVIHAGTNTIVLDAYNANPSSMEAAIRNFNENYRGDKMVVLGDMLELGAESISEHRDLAALIGKLNFREVILVGSQFRKGAQGCKARFFKDAEGAKNWIISQRPEHLNILIKGSRGLKMETTLEAFTDIIRAS